MGRTQMDEKISGPSRANILEVEREKQENKFQRFRGRREEESGGVKNGEKAEVRFYNRKYAGEGETLDAEVFQARRWEVKNTHSGGKFFLKNLKKWGEEL